MKQSQIIIWVFCFRVMVILDPLKITITNFPKENSKQVNVPDFPNEPEKGSHSVTFNKTIYIEASDFKEESEKGYRRLTLTQTVGLRHAGYIIKVKSSFSCLFSFHLSFRKYTI